MSLNTIRQILNIALPSIGVGLISSEIHSWSVIVGLALVVGTFAGNIK